MTDSAMLRMQEHPMPIPKNALQYLPIPISVLLPSYGHAFTFSCRLLFFKDRQPARYCFDRVRICSFKSAQRIVSHTMQIRQNGWHAAKFDKAIPQEDHSVYGTVFYGCFGNFHGDFVSPDRTDLPDCQRYCAALL